MEETNEIDVGRQKCVQHLQEVPDGCDCTEIWEHLSNNREHKEEDERLEEEL